MNSQELAEDRERLALIGQRRDKLLELVTELEPTHFQYVINKLEELKRN